MFLILLVLISFDAIPTNISGLFFPGLIFYKSKGSTNVSKVEKKSKPLLIVVRPANLYAIQKELSTLASIYAYILSLLNKINKDSFIYL